MLTLRDRNVVVVTGRQRRLTLSPARILRTGRGSMDEQQRLLVSPRPGTFLAGSPQTGVGRGGAIVGSAGGADNAGGLRESTNQGRT